jgi:hypothetical protein
VIFSDETKINIWGSDGIRYYWTRKTDKLQPHHLDLTVKHGGESLIMWGCMTWDGVGYGSQIEGNMDAETYCEILASSLKDTLNFYLISYYNKITTLNTHRN